MVMRWSAHTDCINWISYVHELDIVASCSFDCNVFIWNTNCEKIGSLVLGHEKRLWDINIDKRVRNDEERKEAEEMLDHVGDIDYERMFMKQKKDINKERPLIQALKSEHQVEIMAEEKKFENLTEEEQNKLILGN
jgi:hypothetical protein